MAVGLMAITGLSACVSGRAVEPEPAREAIRQAWQANQHIVWEIDWPAAPIGGPLTVETWRADGAYRYEILESPAPALIGQTLVFDGDQSWRYNRFDPEPPLEPAAVPVLSPVSDAFSLIDGVLAAGPTGAARQEKVDLKHGPALKITVNFEKDDRLTVWLDQETDLPARIVFSINGQQATLEARSLEPLPDPPPSLFKPGERAAGS